MNSGHSFPFIKAVTLQVLTKCKSMCHRSDLSGNDKKYMPLYRPRTFKTCERLLLEYVEGRTWYTSINLGDQFRNNWNVFDVYCTFHLRLQS